MRRPATLPGEAEVVILGPFAPSELDPATIEREIRPLLPPCCQLERVSIRVPLPTSPPPHPDNLQWHQDGGGPAGTTHHMVVWASEQPTDLRTSDGTCVATEAGTVIWFDNTRAEHRQPAGTDETRRWFVSVRCSGPTS